MEQETTNLSEKLLKAMSNNTENLHLETHR